MEPLTTIELRTCKWLGILALVASVAAELYAMARGPDARRGSFVNRENIRRAIRRPAQSR